MLAAAPLLVSAGCNILGPIPYLVHGPPKTPAAFTLPADKPVVFLIDDRSSRLPDQDVRRRIGRAADAALLDSKAVKEVIASDSATAVAQKDRYGEPMGIAQIGQAVGAKTIVCVTVDQFSLSEDGATYSPVAVVRVKVVDVETKKRLWPNDPTEWAPLKVQIPVQPTNLPRNMNETVAAEQDLGARLGRAIARLFFEYEARPLEVSPSERTIEQR